MFFVEIYHSWFHLAVPFYFMQTTFFGERSDLRLDIPLDTISILQFPLAGFADFASHIANGKLRIVGVLLPCLLRNGSFAPDGHSLDSSRHILHSYYNSVFR